MLEELIQTINTYFSKLGLNQVEQAHLITLVEQYYSLQAANNLISLSIDDLADSHLSEQDNKNLYESSLEFVEEQLKKAPAKNKRLIPEKEVTELLKEAQAFIARYNRRTGIAQQGPVATEENDHSVADYSNNLPEEGPVPVAQLIQFFDSPVAEKRRVKRISDRETVELLSEASNFIRKFEKREATAFWKKLNPAQKLALHGDSFASQLAEHLDKKEGLSNEFFSNFNEEKSTCTP